MEFKGSRTEANLMAAFAGESQARNKYTYYASQAKKDGYMQIARIFEETAANEKEHAELWFKQLHGGSIPSTVDNLADAAVHFGLLSYAAGLVSRQYVAQLRARTEPAGKPDKAEAKKAAKSRKERKD